MRLAQIVGRVDRAARRFHGHHDESNTQTVDWLGGRPQHPLTLASALTANRWQKPKLAPGDDLGSYSYKSRHCLTTSPLTS